MNNQDLLLLGEGPGTSPPGHGAISNRILLVEDDVAICTLIATALRACGYQVDTAEDGAVGWEALHEKPYDLLITDNSMPKVTGLELVQMIRSEGIEVPVVMASGSIPGEAMGVGAKLRLSATLSKPFTADQLLAVVQQIFSELAERKLASNSPSARTQPVDAVASPSVLTPAPIEVQHTTSRLLN